MINLTDAERDKFVAYLRQEAEASEGLIEASKGIASHGVRQMTQERYRKEAAAYKAVADYLAAWQRL